MSEDADAGRIVHQAVDRRALLLAAAGIVGLAGCTATEPAGATKPAVPGRQAVPERQAVAHQPGVVTPPFVETEYVAFDVTARDRKGLAEALRALSAPAAGVTVTIAAGASLFDGPFGIEGPRRLTRMPSFRGDVLDPRWCHGDLLVQFDADTRERIAAVLARQPPNLRPRWRLAGTRGQRNLFGFAEGAGNPDSTNTELMDRCVWVQPDDDEPAWCAGGTYQVVRLIRLALPIWEAQPTHVQERVVGRHKDTGAALGQSTKEALPEFLADPDGAVIPLDSHIRRAYPRTGRERPILRRGHSYRRAKTDVGQIFVCFQRDVELGFATVQRRLAGEALEKYLRPFGGGYYFVLPGGGDFAGQAMLA
ncbi:deferrochelatase/peroxidase EfeB [Actinoplanes sp. ATCC 53533]|uniref:Dyp-type peroxidase n=1 Tax=Actinoplanes sp. ATCC 53533 TaxID=1288362 RepID=UPI0003874FFF|nr:Dyp-type peroxidase [Actinoplanes sp. ATCC 53533]AGS77304.1 Dyp-type peroxidase [Actinoplanes sp. ATCC 53533]RSM40279.1 deferrochelatase/peroxidase EfeB [Actinoplanes sp. ATCC 53533]